MRQKPLHNLQEQLGNGIDCQLPSRRKSRVYTLLDVLPGA